MLLCNSLPYDDTEERGSSVGRGDTALLTEIRDNYKSFKEYWDPIYAEGDIDMQFRLGDSWDPSERENRTGGTQQTKRLCLSFDELGQNVHQVNNNFRQNKPAIEVTPKGNGANDKTAEMRANKIRDIEYKSNATTAYTIAFENAVNRSYGFVEATRIYESSMSMNQEIIIEAISNPNTVLGDPQGKLMDGSDWKRCFKLCTYTHAEFKDKWPDAEIVDFTLDTQNQYVGWVSEKLVTVVSYWKVNEERKTLLVLDRPISVDGEEPKTNVLLEDFPKAKATKGQFTIEGVFVAGILAKRPTIIKSVCEYVCNGIEILEENPQPGEYIPIVPFFGEEMWVGNGGESKRVINSLIRRARDSQTSLDYVGTVQMEIIGQIPKAPYIGYTGQFMSDKANWDNVNRVRIPYLQADPVLDSTGQAVLPLPQQTHYEPAIQALEMKLDSLRRAIQSAMGISPLPTSALRRNEKSGVALQQIEENQSVGSYHFLDNAKMSIAHIGRIVGSWLAPTYDTDRQIGVRQSDGKYKMESTMQPGPDGQPVNIFSIGEHEETIGTGPSYQSQRDKADKFSESLMANPMIAPLVAADVIRLQDLGPIGDRMAEDAEFLQPPELRAKRQQEQSGKEPIPQEALEAIAKLHDENSQLKQMVAELQPEQTKRQIAVLQTTAEERKAAREDETKRWVAVESNRTTIAAKLIDVTHETNVTVLDHQVTEIQRKAQAQATQESAATSHEQALESSELSHSQALEMADKEASLQPEKE